MNIVAVDNPPPVLSSTSVKDHALLSSQWHQRSQACLPSYPQGSQSLEQQQPAPHHQSILSKSSKGDSYGSDSEDPFQLDSDSMDISKMTIEQLNQMDPRQAQLWMLLKMHQMVKKVEDVYESTEQLYSFYDMQTKLPAKPPPQLSKGGPENKPKVYENARLKRPVPKPRKRKVKNVSDNEAAPNDDLTTTRLELVAPSQEATASSQEDTVPSHQENKSSQVKHGRTVKQYRREDVISKLLLVVGTYYSNC